MLERRYVEPEAARPHRRRIHDPCLPGGADRERPRSHSQGPSVLHPGTCMDTCRAEQLRHCRRTQSGKATVVGTGRPARFSRS